MSIVELADGRIVLERLFGHFEFGIDDHLQEAEVKKKRNLFHRCGYYRIYSGRNCMEISAGLTHTGCLPVFNQWPGLES